MKNIIHLALAAALIASPLSFAKGGHATSHYVTSNHSSRYAQGVHRDASGRITRSPKAKSDFKKSNPCPSTGRSSGSCPGYVIDHVVPLKRGGADAPRNMQWQTKDAAREKDKWE